MHHPYLPPPGFAGKSGNGPFADMMVEHDYRVGEVLDAIESGGLTPEQLERSMSAIRWSVIKSRVKSTLGVGDD